MKAPLLVLLLSCALLLSFFQSAFPQYSWESEIKLTSGYNDRNPSFGPQSSSWSYNAYGFEFFIFERNSAITTNICVLKMGLTGPVGGVVNLTTNAAPKRNPFIAYSMGQWPYPYNIAYAVAVWEEYRNTRWDLYASSYDSVAGWSQPYAFDTASFSKSNPRGANTSGSDFIIAYEKNGDVIYREFNSVTKSVTAEANLTSLDTSYCSNPNAIRTYGSNSSVLVTYNRRKADGKSALYYARRVNNIWISTESIAYSGNNYFNDFENTYSSYLGIIFESDRIGRKNMYISNLNTYNWTQTLDTVTYLRDGDNYSFRGVLYPVITDYYSFFHAWVFLKKSGQGIKLMMNKSYSDLDSALLGDSSKSIKLTLNQGIFYNWNAIGWAVYNKDSASSSSLYARRKIIIINDIRKINNEIPIEFSLNQNYPNPFNPRTNITFQIPEKSNVTIKVFDITGKVVSEPVNGKFEAGNYIAGFDGSHLSSGVYFYRMETDRYYETRKMILLK